MRRRGKTFLSLFLSAVIVTGQPVLAADFSAGEETFISETTEQEGDVSEASAIFEDTVDSDSEMRYEKYEATVSSEILDLGQTGVNGSGWGWERLEIKNTGTEAWHIKSIMYTAALANASKELEEAATMDGANLLQQIWYVELPAIKNIIVIQFILQAGNIMSIGFEKAYALQTDMNLPASEILSTYVYRIGLLNGDYGYSTAVGLFNSVVNVILLIFVNCVVKKLNDGEGL